MVAGYGYGAFYSINDTALEFAKTDNVYIPNAHNRKVYDQLLKKYDLFIECTKGHTKELSKSYQCIENLKNNILKVWGCRDTKAFSRQPHSLLLIFKLAVIAADHHRMPELLLQVYINPVIYRMHY